jgi:putative tryptophan/tyrosine transport system substrate-binding protein
MRRRAFISVLGGIAAWPLAARAQQADRVRRIGVLMVGNASERRDRALILSLQALESLGWTSGRNLLVDALWASGDGGRMRANATELVSTNPELIVAQGTLNLAAAGQVTQTIPIVFTEVTDPIATGLVEGFSRPGRNVTGFTNLEPSIVGKWIGLLKQAAPRVKRIGMVFDPEITPGRGSVYTIPFEKFAPDFDVEAVRLPFNGAAEFGLLMDTFLSEGGNGLLAATGTFVRRDVILANALRLRLPNVFPYREFAQEGGLISYGVDISDLYRRAASYVDRILKGESASSLPVQNPVKFEMLINTKTAKTLGLEIPSSLLALADELIE